MCIITSKLLTHLPFWLPFVFPDMNHRNVAARWGSRCPGVRYAKLRLLSFVTVEISPLNTKTMATKKTTEYSRLEKLAIQVAETKDTAAPGILVKLKGGKMHV